MLSVKNLTKIYKTKGGEDVKALNNVSLDFPETGMVFLLGKSGSGKSTLLNLIGGLDAPTSGEVILKGKSSKGFNQSDFDSYRNTYIGFIFQEYNILNEFNVEHNIGLAMELQHKKVKKSDIDALLEQVDLKDYAKRKPNTLSGGQKQRIAIARALIKNPRIILADEPTGALDSKTGAQVFDTLKKLSQDKLIIIVSHDRDFAETYADRIIELKDGEILTDETKFKKEAEKLTENVSIINENSIKINNAKQLTKEEFIKLYDTIKNSDGEVFISSGENAQKSMKVNRISASGESENFKHTEKIELKQYNPKETKFIRSKMPLGKSIKMGLSSLKTKPIRLIFTILLAVVSFAMFGVVSSLMLYKSAYTYAEALKNVDYSAEKIEKKYNGTSIYRNYKNGTLQYESKGTFTKETLFGVNEISDFNLNNNLNMYAVGINSVSMYIPQNITVNQEYYSCFKIEYATDCGLTELNKLGFTLTGTYPQNKNEIALPYEYFNLLKDNNTEITTIEDAIGKTISFNSKNLTITGFVNVGEIPSTYSELKNANSSLSVNEKSKLFEKLKEYVNGSFNCVAFVNTELGDVLYRNAKSNTAVYVNSNYKKGISVSTYNNSNNEISSDYGTSFYYFDTYLSNKNAFKIYNYNNEPISITTLNSNDAIISKYKYAQMLFDKLNVLYQLVRYDYANLKYYTYVNDYINSINDRLEEIYNYNEENRYNLNNVNINEVKNIISELETIVDLYKIEFNKEQIVNTLIYTFMETGYFNNLTEENKQKFYDIRNNYDISIEKFNYVFNTIYNNFDTVCPNYFILDYLRTIYNYNDTGRYLVEDNSVISSIDFNNNTYLPLTQNQVEIAKEFINNNYYKITFNNIYGFETSELNFIDYRIPTISNKLYYKNYLGQIGYFNILGYHDNLNGNDCPIIDKAFINSISISEEYEYESQYNTNYEAPQDERYRFIMATTNYSTDEIDYITKQKTDYAYYLTNNIYLEASMIASMISQLKTIFFWVGVVLGAFSALMLLNFITISISSKKKDIGVLRAIGARKGDVFKIFFSESLFIGMLCFILASVATYIVEFFLNKSFIDKIGITVLEFGIVNIGLIFAIALAITFISTIFPVLHSSRKPPVEAIRSL